jgi:AraC-like DNA-binding protein
MDYIQIVRIFAEQNSLTLKQYIIGERVNKVKQLIHDHTGSLTEIAEQMHYSSSAHLCNELKRVTGNTPKSYK